VKPEHPAGHRDTDTVGGKIKDQRVHHFGLASRAKYAAARRGSRFPAQLPVALLQLAQLSRLLLSDTRPSPSSISASFSQRCRHDTEIPKTFATCAIGTSPLRATATTSRRNSTGNASA
jgi:hypothetical protein